MNKTTFIKLLLNLKKQSNVGISLTELLVALVMSSIILTAAASGFVNLLRANQDVESKTVRSAGLARALNFIQEDVKQAVSVEAVTETDDSNCDSGKVDSVECLKITLPTSAGGGTIYYGFKDISDPNTPSEFLKPGILKRQEYNLSNNPILETDQSEAWDDLFTTVADGLIHSSHTPQPTTTCDQDGINWSGDNNIYGNDDTGFRFCTSSDDRLVRIFLYGYVGRNQPPFSANIVTFARSGS